MKDELWYWPNDGTIFIVSPHRELWRLKEDNNLELMLMGCYSAEALSKMGYVFIGMI